jgi:uncharacterized integral membrane protein
MNRTTTQTDLDAKAERRIRHRQTIRVVLVLAVLAVVALFLIDNSQRTTVGWTFGETDAPLFAFLLGAFALGVPVGMLIAHRRAHHH